MRDNVLLQDAATEIMYWLQDAAAERKFHHGIHLQPVHKLRDVVVGVLIYHLGKVAYAISIHHRLALELSTYNGWFLR